MAHYSISNALARVFQISVRLHPQPQPIRTSINSIPNSRSQPNRNFSTSPTSFAKKAKGARPDRRITLIRHFLHHPTQHTPRPLRLSRNRSLRHWTIVRAWRRFQSHLRTTRVLELQRQYHAMSAANEELRIGIGDGGRLFRRGMMKRGVWDPTDRIKQSTAMMGMGGTNGVPIEYARGLQEWVGSTGGLGRGSKAKIWDGEWKRWVGGSGGKK